MKQMNYILHNSGTLFTILNYLFNDAFSVSQTL
jgi:hypothetical protein